MNPESVRPKTLYRTDHARVMQTALQVLQHSGVRRLPIDLFAIVDFVPNLVCCPYSRLAEKNRLTVREVCALLGSDFGAYAHNPSSSRHVIYYNDRTENTGLMRFTLAHELGHFFLFHMHAKSGVPYAVLESEVNFFARNLMAPVPLVDGILHKELTPAEAVQVLMDRFGLSEEAAATRYKSLPHDRKVLRHLSKAPDLQAQFEEELKQGTKAS